MSIERPLVRCCISRAGPAHEFTYASSDGQSKTTYTTEWLVSLYFAGNESTLEAASDTGREGEGEGATEAAHGIRCKHRSNMQKKRNEPCAVTLYVHDRKPLAQAVMQPR